MDEKFVLAILTSCLTVLGMIILQVIIYIKDKIFKKSDNIKLLLSNLYGPILFYLESNKSILDHCKEIEKKYDEYKSKLLKDVKNEEAKKNIYKSTSAQFSGIIELNNIYSEKIKENNSHIIEIIKSNFYLIESNDINKFIELIIDKERLNIEVDNKMKSKIPFEVLTELKPIYYFKDDFYNFIKSKFFNYRKKLLI